VSDADLKEKLVAQLRTLQIIIFAMAAGVIIFLVVAIGIRPTIAADQPADQGQMVMTYTSLLFAVMAVILHWVIPNVVVGAALTRLADETPEDVDEELIRLFTTKTIISGAMLEGAALFTIVAHMVEGEWLPIVLAIVLLVLLVARIPTHARMADWMDLQTRRIGQ